MSDNSPKLPATRLLAQEVGRRSGPQHVPALLDVKVQRQELSMPPTITVDQARGFGLYLLHAVLSDRGDEVLDLAETNLFSRLFS